MKQILAFLFVFMLLGCAKQSAVKHSFFVAGHTYGDPVNKSNNKGLYKPFKAKTEYINNQPKLETGFLLGDVVWHPNFWPEAEKDIEKFDASIYIARGNHDGSLKRFESKFGKSYHSFKKNDDLFIVLDPNIDKWNISGDQLVFLMNALRNEGKNANNIFIFAHQVLWYTKDKYSKPPPNSLQNRDVETNFWSKIEPLLRLQKTPVYIFAGDVGAFSKEKRKQKYVVEYGYYNYDNITFVATGMGGGIRDNFVIVDIYNTGEVKLRLIHLNGEDLESLGKLEAYNTLN